MSVGNIEFAEFNPVGEVPFADVAIRLNDLDDVAIAKTNLQAGTVIILDDRTESHNQLTVQNFIPAGHKIALRGVASGESVRRYAQIIGFATQPIQPGAHVHAHNLGVSEFDRDYAFGEEVRPLKNVSKNGRRNFYGYRRSNGKVGTRNYIVIISSVNCSAHTSREIAHYFSTKRLADYPNIDGVIALTHLSGCSTRVGSVDYERLQRTLAGMARNPNVGATLFVGLGCETNQIADLIANYGLTSADDGRAPAAPPHVIIQDSGGIRKSVEIGISGVKELLPQVNAAQRTVEPVSELTVALQCGGSDGWSGITANPVVGLVADQVVGQGGTVVLAETPEVYGAEHLLTRRAIRPEIGQKLVEKVRWWEAYTRRMGLEINNNPTPGNKAGGLTTIYEKSLGAVAKGGRTPLTGVYDYAEPVTARGLTFMDTPGYDPVSVTGMVAGGCNLVLFTTGRGSVFGFKPAPSIKICTNSATFNRMAEDMDLNAGQVLEGSSLENVASELLELVINVASGRPSKSEAQGVGEAEFNPWSIAGTL